MGSTRSEIFTDASFSSGRGVRALVNYDGFLNAVRQLPIILIEKDGKRDVTSIFDLGKSAAFWTTDSAFFRSAEALIREVPTSSSVTSVLTALGTEMVNRSLQSRSFAA